MSKEYAPTIGTILIRLKPLRDSRTQWHEPTGRHVAQHADGPPHKTRQRWRSTVTRAQVTEHQDFKLIDTRCR
jgi:hypothetical protein